MDSPRTSSALSERLAHGVLQYRTLAAGLMVVLLFVVDATLAASAVVEGNQAALTAELVALLAVPLGVWLLDRRRPDLTGHLVLGVISVAACWTALQGRGLYSGAAVLLVVLPVFGGLTAHRGGVLTWTLLPAGVLGILAWSHHNGELAPIPEHLSPHMARLRMHLIALGTVSGGTAIFLGLHRRTVVLLQDSLAALQDENEDRRRAEAAARTAADTQARFLATMSHELRTPLNGVICAARLLEGPVDPGRHAELLGTLGTSAEGLLSLIDDILDYSRLEQNALPIEAVAVDLRRLLRQATDSLALVASQRGLRLTIDVDNSVPDAIVGDPTRLRQVVVNLVGNAIKFTKQGGVDVVARAQRGTLTIRVEDTGIGIEAAHLAQLFEPFTQADSSTSRRFGGTGLGLAISRRLVHRMGGKLAVVSEVGVGTAFELCIPVTESDAARAAPAPPSSDRGLRVLVVDDNAVNRMLQTMLLEQWGHQPDAADGGGEAVAMALGDRWDLILMDCQMPGVDGFTATRLIRSSQAVDAQAWVVGLSADARVEARSEALAAGMDDFITKPLRPAAFLQTLQRRREGRSGRTDTDSADVQMPST
mgnify:CR=1 FL=1